MKGVAFWFMVLAAISGLTGMVWGIALSASGDHGLSPAHGHLNLIGWIGMAVFAFYYHLVPPAAQSIIAKLHLAVAALGLIVIVPGIALVLQGGSPIPAKIGSGLTLLSMILFAIAVIRGRKLVKFV